MIDNFIVNHVPADVLLRLMTANLSVAVECQHSWASQCQLWGWSTLVVYPKTLVNPKKLEIH